jgi:hypothetical protein
MKKYFHIILCSIFFSFSTGLKSDSEGLISLQEMLFKSLFVVDGEIISLESLGTEAKTFPDKLPIVRTKYKALFRIDKVVKGKLPDDKTETTALKLIYWRINIRNHKSKNEKMPELKKGDTFRLFSNVKLVPDEEGELTIFLGTPNQIRPEGYSVTRKTEATPEASTEIISAIKKSASIPDFIGPDSKPELKTNASIAWVGMLLIFAIASALFWFGLKSRLH